MIATIATLTTHPATMTSSNLRRPQLGLYCPPRTRCKLSTQLQRALRASPVRLPLVEHELLPSIAATCREYRQLTGLTYAHVAVHVARKRGTGIKYGVSESTLARFELARHWPEDPEAVVKAYAEATGIPALDLWDVALTRWRDETRDNAALMSPACPA